MRLRNIPGSREAIGASEYVIPEESECAGKWRELFGNENPIHVEIGTGKGRFLMELAKVHPEISYVGIEKYSSVLLRAIQKMEEEPLSNVKFIRMEAEHILRYFAKGEVPSVNFIFCVIVKTSSFLVLLILPMCLKSSVFKPFIYYLLYASELYLSTDFCISCYSFSRRFQGHRYTYLYVEVLERFQQRDQHFCDLHGRLKSAGVQKFSR